MSTQLKAIAFDSDIAKLTENFTGRQWVFDDIDRWLKESEERFFILTGEPGVGKSAIAARLTQIRDDIAAYHFCRAGDVETVRPARILRSLAAQMGEHLPDYGQALANTIKPVHLRVEVNINIGSMTGSQVTGVYIENLKESDPENELDILIRAPLEELQKMYAEHQKAQPSLAIILIDSLDEAVTTTGATLVKLLTQLSKSTSLPSWVRFIMTSRPERRVLRGFEPLKPYHLREKSDESLADVRQYIEDRVDQPALQDQLQVNQVQPQTLISEITNLSHGNFLYTTLLLNDIEAGRQALDNLAALPKSIDDIYHGFLSRFSEEDWSDRYKPIFGVLTVAQEAISEKQISNFTKIDPEDVRDSIRIARQFFDVELDEQNNETYSIFHQSLRDYLLDEDRNSDFWCNDRKQHQRIIDFCEKTSKSWYELERIDAYGRKHLAQHLVKGDRVDELHTLLNLEKDGKNAWFQVKDQLGETADFLADVQLAWDQADIERTAIAMNLQCRYVLITTSVNSTSKNMRGDLLVALVQAKQWSPIKALTYARQVPGVAARVTTLHKLGQGLPEPYNQECLQAALKSVELIPEIYARVYALKELIPSLPFGLLQDVLTIAQKLPDEPLSRAQTQSARAYVLMALAPRISNDLISEVFHTALSLLNPDNTITTLIPYLPEALIVEGLEVARDIQLGLKDYYKGTFKELFIALAPKLPKSLVSEALTLARAVQDKDSCVKCLIALSCHTPEICLETLDAALNLYNGSFQIEELKQLIPHLSDILLARVIDFSYTLQEESNRHEIWIALAPYLCEAQLSNLLRKVEAIPYEYTRAEILTSLILYFPDKLLYEVLNIAQVFGDQYNYLKVLITLAPRIPDALSQAFNIVQSILQSTPQNHSLGYYIDLLVPLVPHLLETDLITVYQLAQLISSTQLWIQLAHRLPEELLDEALKDIFRIANESDRIQILIILIPRLTENNLFKALDLAQTLNSESDRTNLLVALAPYIPASSMTKVMEVLSSFSSHEKAKILIAFAPYLLLPLLHDALKEAQLIQTLDTQLDALIAIAPYLLEALFVALRSASEIHDEYPQAKFFIRLADHIPDSFSYAYRSALAILEPSYKAEILTLLVPHFPEAILDALTAVRAITDGNAYQTSRCLINLLPYLLDHLPEALRIAKSIPDKRDKLNALIAIIPHLPEAKLEALKVAQEPLNDGSEQPDIFSLVALAPHLPEILPIAFAAAKAIQNNLEQKISVLLRLSPCEPEALSEALRIIQTLKSKYHVAEELAAVAQHFSSSQQIEFLQADYGVRSWLDGNMYNHFACNIVLTSLVPYLQDELLPEVLDISRSSLSPQDCLIALIPRLPNQLAEILQIARLQDAKARSNILVALMPCLPELETEVLQSIFESEQYGSLVDIAPHLSPALLPEAFKLVMKIQDVSSCAVALAVLGIHCQEWLVMSIEMAQSIPEDWHQFRTLKEIAPYSPMAAAKAFGISQANKDDDTYDNFRLDTWINYLPDSLLAEAFKLAQKTLYDDHRVPILEMLMPRLVKQPRDELLTLWQEILHLLSGYSREEFLKRLAEAIPILIAIHGQDSIAKIATEVQNAATCSWASTTN